MSRKCELTGKGVLVGNNVSHSQIKTKRRFLPNIHNVTLLSDALGAPFRFKVASSTLRTVEHRGGLDSFLLKEKDENLSPKAQKVKRSIKTALAK